MAILTLTLTTGESFQIGDFLVSEGGALDAWTAPGQAPDDWVGVWAPHAWLSVTTGDEPSGEVVPIR